MCWRSPAPHRSRRRARRCSLRAGPARTGRRWRWPRPKHARRTIAASRRCSRSNIRSRARCRRRCSAGCACAARRRSRGERSTRPVAEISIRPRAPKGPPFTSWRSRIAACWRPRTSRSTKTSRSGSPHRAGRRSPPKPTQASAPSTSCSRPAARVRPASASSRPRARARRALSASDARTVSSGRARCAGRPPAAWRPSPCSRWRPGRSCGSCAEATTAAGRFETLTPATADPDTAVGYAEAAGFSPDGGRVLVVREAARGGQLTRRFQVVESATLVVETMGRARRQAGGVQALELAVVARRNAGAPMSASTLRLALLLAIVAAIGCHFVLA